MRVRKSVYIFFILLISVIHTIALTTWLDNNSDFVHDQKAEKKIEELDREKDLNANSLISLVQLDQ